MEVRDRIFDNVAEGLSELVGVYVDEVKPDSKLIEDLGMDSLDMTEGIMGLEEEYDIEIEDEDAEKWRTVGDVVDHLVKVLS